MQTEKKSTFDKRKRAITIIHKLMNNIKMLETFYRHSDTSSFNRKFNLFDINKYL